MPKTIILIPSRLSATRLPRKPLLKINNLPIICHVANKAKESDIGEVYVCTGDKEIYDIVKNNGSNCILTDKEHHTGTDRIYEGLQKLNISNVDYVLNLQGDEPMINIKDIRKLNDRVNKNFSDIATLACEIDGVKKYSDENIVKVQTYIKLDFNNYSRAKNFFRKINILDEKNIYHHIGIYQYKTSVLKKYINLLRTKNEIKFKLEQLRAIENKINIDVFLTNNIHLGVDTKKEYIEIKKLME
tara:strand:- start:170 stop:901 length:732 start_codon:yes stop_codon:yes gene_type:complete